MARKHTRRSVSLSRAIYDVLKVHCEVEGISMSGFAEVAICSALGTERPAARAVRPPENTRDPRVVAEEREMIERHVREREYLAKTMAARGPQGPAHIPVSEGLMEMVEDECERRRELLGIEATPSGVLDEAINRTLDAIDDGMAPLSLEEVV